MARNDSILDRYIAQRMLLSSVEDTATRDVLKILRKGQMEALGELASAYSDLLASSTDPVAWSGRGLEFRVRMQRAIQDALGSSFPEARRNLRDTLRIVGREQVDTYTEALRSAFSPAEIRQIGMGTIPQKQMEAIVRNRLGVGKAGALDELRNIESMATARSVRTIQESMHEGVGMREMVGRSRESLGFEARGVGGRATGRYVQGAVQGVANDTDQQIFVLNSDIVTGEQYHATLDSDTCIRCGPLDGRVSRGGKPALPRPQLHDNCRCFIAPLVGEGPAPKRVRWRQWVQRSQKRMRAVFGPTRAAGIRNGTVDINDLSTRTRILRLDEVGLRRREASDE